MKLHEILVTNGNDRKKQEDRRPQRKKFTQTHKATMSIKCEGCTKTSTFVHRLPVGSRQRLNSVVCRGRVWIIVLDRILPHDKPRLDQDDAAKSDCREHHRAKTLARLQPFCFFFKTQGGKALRPEPLPSLSLPAPPSLCATSLLSSLPSCALSPSLAPITAEGVVIGNVDEVEVGRGCSEVAR